MFVHRGGGVSENGVAGQLWPVERGNEWKWCLTVGDLSTIHLDLFGESIWVIVYCTFLGHVEQTNWCDDGKNGKPDVSPGLGYF